MILSLTHGMELVRHQSFSGSAFPLNKNRAVSWSRHPDHFFNLGHLRALAYDLFLCFFLSQCLPEDDVFYVELTVFESALHCSPQFVRCKGLGKEIKGP